LGVLDRVNTAMAKPAAMRAVAPLSFDEWADYFSFGGVGYPVIQTTMGQVDRERIIATSPAAYESNGPVFALVAARVQAFSQTRFQWTRFQGSQPGDLFGTPELRLLEKPWPNGTTADLLARMEVDVSLAGNCYIRRTSATQLNRLRPDYVTIIFGSQADEAHPAYAPDLTVAGYMYMPPTGGVWLFTPEQVAHYAPLPDPYFNFLGISWLTPVIRELQADSLTTEHKARFFANAATPNMAIKFDAQTTIQQVKAFKELMEDEHRGAFNAYKTLYLGGGADPTVIGADMKQLDFAATQGKGESRLAAAAGVPPSWVGFSEGLQGSSLNAGNFNSARRRFSDGTLVHLWTNAAASLEAILSPPPGASLWFDTRVPFMREDAADRASIAQQEASTIGGLIRDGFTPESAVKAVMNGDWSVLEHTGLTSVQLLPPSTGEEPLPGVGNAPAVGAGPDKQPPALPAGASGNGQKAGVN
jgi:phage portal protein BeeE